jgi:hypothetical protein
MFIERAALNSLLAFTLAFNVFTPNRAEANADDPPSRVARVAFIEGSVSFQPAGTQDWVAAPLNRPLTTGDTLWSDAAAAPAPAIRTSAGSDQKQRRQAFIHRADPSNSVCYTHCSKRGDKDGSSRIAGQCCQKFGRADTVEH